MPKPSKKRIFCPDCGKSKILFETEKEAQTFIKFNSEEIENGEKLRPYYCPACCGYHVSHKKHYRGFDTRTDEMIEDYRRDLSNKDSFDKKLNKKSMLFTISQKVEYIMSQIDFSSLKNYKGTRPKAFLDDFFDRWWKDNERYDGSEQVEAEIRTIVYKKYKKSAKKV